MASSLRDSLHNPFALPKQLPHWSQYDRPAPPPSDPNRPPMVHPEPLRPIEPGESAIRRPFSSNRSHEDLQSLPRQQLPGVHELLSPPIRTVPQSPRSGSWAPINNPSSWPDRVLPHVGNPLPPHTASTPLHQPYRQPMEMTMADSYRQANTNLPMGNIQRQPSMPSLPLRQQAIASPTGHGHQDPRMGDYFTSPSYHSMAGYNQTDEMMLDQPSSSNLTSKTNASGGVINLQIVGQRDIPGEGLCYVFKDGSTCPTVIDGEPVNPLWGTTKAGKARKRLAQACLNCREKKIKCEPGETSCLQCEKAKRECLRPSVAQTPADMAEGSQASSSGNSEWKVHTSPRSPCTVDIPAPKRRRSAHIAQQESALDHSAVEAISPGSEPKRQRSEDSSSAVIMRPTIERQRKDSKRPSTEEDELIHATRNLGKPDMLAQAEDPYRVEPEGTILFLDLFFAQSTHETHLLFPRRAFTRWVKSCSSKTQLECMVLYAVLALGSAFSNNRFSSFARVCIERASQAAAGNFGCFSVALVQARLLLGAYSLLKGKEGLAWDYNGSAIRVLSAMNLNTEEGCDGDLNEYPRRYFSFTREQLRECKRRTFWTGFLMDCYNGFSSGLLSTLNEDEVRVRFPSDDHTYEDGSPSTAPLFHSTGNVSPDTQIPAAHVITISTIWKESNRFTHRSTNVPASAYPVRYESFFDDITRRLSDWSQGLPQHLKYSRENLERSIYHDYAGEFISMHTLHLFSHLKLARMVRHELLPRDVVARKICAAHSYALKILALLRDIRVLTISSPSHNRRTTDFISPFISYAVSSAIDTLGAGGLREEYVAEKQILHTAVEVLQDVSKYCIGAWVQLRNAEKRLGQIEAWPADLDVRAGRSADGRCWRITEPMEKTLSLQLDVIYGVSSSTFAEALTEGRKR